MKPQFKQDNEIQFNALLMNDSGEGFLGLQAEYDDLKQKALKKQHLIHVFVKLKLMLH